MASAADLPVHLMEDIFLRLDDVADLVRASASCAFFHCVISNSHFLRRFRSFHCPPVLGLLSTRLRFHPAELPHCSAQAARAIPRAAGLFTSSFHPADPTQHCWHVHDDVRNGRVLLSQSNLMVYDNEVATCLSLSNLVVYDPLHRKHVQIPPIPNDLVGCTCMGEYDFCCCDCDCDYEFIPFLVPSNADEDNLSFQVTCTMLSADSNGLKTFVYSSVTGKWCGVPSLGDVYCQPVHYLFFLKRHYAHGCIYWLDYSDEDMLVLDMNEMKFSVVRLPPETNREFKIVVKAAEEGTIGLLVLREDTLHLTPRTLVVQMIAVSGDTML